MRRLATMSACILLALGGVGLAQPAQAATLAPLTLTCSATGGQGNGPRVITSPSNMIWSAAPGDTFTVTNNTGQLLTPSIPSGYTATYSPGLSSGNMVNGSVATVTVGSSDDTVSFLGFSPGTCTGYGSFIQVSFSAAPSPNPPGPAAAVGSAPAPIVQQFGLPASGTCDAAASASLNWAGVASGGWSISWGEWMNGGRGGAVCTRTLVYSTRAGAWGVAS